MEEKMSGFTLHTSSLVYVVLEAKGRNCGQTQGQEVL